MPCLEYGYNLLKRKLPKTSSSKLRAGCCVNMWPGVTTALQRRCLVYSFWWLSKLSVVIPYLWTSLPTVLTPISVWNHLWQPSESCPPAQPHDTVFLKWKILHVPRPQSWKYSLRTHSLERKVSTNFRSVLIITGFSMVLDMWVLKQFSYQVWWEWTCSFSIQRKVTSNSVCSLASRSNLLFLQAKQVSHLPGDVKCPDRLEAVALKTLF